jgi:hypothetical protein
MIDQFYQVVPECGLSAGKDYLRDSAIPEFIQGRFPFGGAKFPPFPWPACIAKVTIVVTVIGQS